MGMDTKLVGEPGMEGDDMSEDSTGPGDPPGKKIGYACPPDAHKFKKGQSGNPRGRPKGSQNLGTIMMKAALMPVEVVSGGKKKKYTTIEAITMKLREKALKGDPKAIASFFSAYEQFGPAPTPDLSGYDAEADEAALAYILSKLPEEDNSDDA